MVVMAAMAAAPLEATLVSHPRHQSYSPRTPSTLTHILDSAPAQNDQEAQRLYNHLRTFAWYADSLPLLSPKLPFNIGLDAIIGFIPYVGDAIGALIGLYLVFLASLFGLPVRILAVMVALVVVDTVVGAVPLVGDALDVAFKVSSRRAQLTSFHLTPLTFPVSPHLNHTSSPTPVESVHPPPTRAPPHPDTGQMLCRRVPHRHAAIGAIHVQECPFVRWHRHRHCPLLAAERQGRTFPTPAVLASGQPTSIHAAEPGGRPTRVPPRTILDDGGFS